MSRLRTRSSSWLWLIAPLALVLGACASDPTGPEPTPIQDQGVQVKEPLTGLPEAPPLGAPRPKLVPGDVVRDKEDEDGED